MAKSELIEKARQHYATMESVYSTEIQQSEDTSVIYAHMPELPPTIKDVDTNYLLWDMDTVSAIYLASLAGDKVVALNFADYVNPGGRYMQGSTAQEESLCAESTLYNVLWRFKERYYDINAQNKNYGLYTDKCLYTPDIVFDRGNVTIKADVITCAAPNNSACNRCGIDYAKVMQTMERRFDFICDIAEHQGVDTLILGAWGCGVFKNDPDFVADMMIRVLRNDHPCFSRVIFAVPNKLSRNYRAFERVM